MTAFGKLVDASDTSTTLLPIGFRYRWIQYCIISGNIFRKKIVTMATHVYCDKMHVANGERL